MAGGAGSSARARGAGRERVGVLGGTFDPVHIAHLVAASAARHALDLDRVLLVVAGDPWQKRESVVASAADRLEMTRAAVDGMQSDDRSEGLEVSALEVERSGPTYTIDTLRAIADADRDLFLIVGSDVATRLDTWHRADEVRAAATLVVVSRGDAPDEAGTQPATGSHTAAVAGRVIGLRIPRLDVSSTALRERVARGESIDVLVPAGAVRVIRERRLYTRS